jgi:hypothetical protein
MPKRAAILLVEDNPADVALLHQFLTASLHLKCNGLL